MLRKDLFSDQETFDPVAKTRLDPGLCKSNKASAVTTCIDTTTFSRAWFANSFLLQRPSG